MWTLGKSFALSLSLMQLMSDMSAMMSSLDSRLIQRKNVKGKDNQRDAKRERNI